MEMRIKATLVSIAITLPSLAVLFLPGDMSTRAFMVSFIVTGFLWGDQYEQSWNGSSCSSKKPPLEDDAPADKPQGDMPANLQVNFQDPVTDYMEGLFLLNQSSLVLVFLITGLVGWLVLITLSIYRERRRRKALRFVHDSVYESGWAVVPLLVLILLPQPLPTLLYSLQGECKTNMSVQIVGHQCTSTTGVVDNLLCLPEQIAYFYFYHLVNEFTCLEKSGIERNLEANGRVMLPLGVQVKMSVSGADVLHSWTIPSFGVKVDYLGRPDIVYVVVKRIGLFFGQCSEICGVNHGFMPIAAVVIPGETFRGYLNARVNNLTHMF
jgi:heme/copper-type cytochrome/quinol oxidase subunit 2